MHDIFSRFRDLNLVTLITDLERYRVARGGWILSRPYGRDMCPVAHGWDKFIREGFIGGNCVCRHNESAKAIGISIGKIGDFTDSWDTLAITSQQLLTVLRDIWRERLADADAVQEVINQQEHECISSSHSHSPKPQNRQLKQSSRPAREPLTPKPS